VKYCNTNVLVIHRCHNHMQYQTTGNTNNKHAWQCGVVATCWFESE